MQYIILISNPNYKLGDMEVNLPRHLITCLNKGGGALEAKIGNELITVRRDDSISSDFDENELIFIKNVTKTPEFYFINYKDIETLKIFLQYIADRNDIVIDNDCELIVTGKEFISMLKEKPGWDWVSEYGAKTS